MGVARHVIVLLTLAVKSRVPMTTVNRLRQVTSVQPSSRCHFCS
jgi:hypothetical protein